MSRLSDWLLQLLYTLFVNKLRKKLGDEGIDWSLLPYRFDANWFAKFDGDTLPRGED